MKPLNLRHDLAFTGFLILLLLSLASCGGGDSPSPSASSDQDFELSNNQTIEPTDFTGKVVVKFKDGTDVRLHAEEEDGPFAVIARNEETKQSPASVRNVNSIVKGIASPASGGLAMTKRVTRITEVSEEELDKRREKFARRGIKLHDWNLAYFVEVPDENEARELVKQFNADPNVEYVEILPKFYVSSITTPDISDEQWHLKSASQGGLGIEDAWAKLDAKYPDVKLRGQGTQVTDQEFDWNFDHEVLPIDDTSEYLLGYGVWLKYGTDEGKGVPENIQHGTAVMGILTAQGEDVGKAVRGIVPNATPRVTTGGGAFVGSGSLFAESLDPVGSIMTVEVQQRGISSQPASGCAVESGISNSIGTGCVPVESHKYVHAIIKDSTLVGSIIIEGAGNGSVDLNNDSLAAPSEGMGAFSYFSKPENDSGSILVGASLGPDLRKAPWSNCGSRVDVFAGGAGIVTSGYGDHPASTASDPNKWYTKMFGGTSAATAQIGGVAVMVQSYVRKVLDDLGYVSKTIYLDSRQIRKILKESGQSAVYDKTPDDPNPNCNIGVQPDAAKAIDIADDYIKTHNLNVVPLRDGVVSGIRYDMDGDGKADLISFSRDHKWYIDLSATSPESQVTSSDGYGSWDLIIPSPLTGEGQGGGDSAITMLFPAVHDYNSDGRADLAVYDSLNGKWYIKYTTNAVIASPKGEAIQWDRVIDYSQDSIWKKYSRPLPGDYDNDDWLDLALQTPDGHWLIDYGGFDGVSVIPANAGISSVKYLDRFGEFEKDVPYLTVDQLSQAPGWAWLPVVEKRGSESYFDNLFVKTPDGILNSNNVSLTLLHSDGTFKTYSTNKYVTQFGDNDSYFTIAGYSGSMASQEFGFKKPNGEWSYLELTNGNSWGLNPQISPDPQDFGDINCRPIPADYDGDGKDDRAVQCGNTWKINYSSDSTNMTEIKLTGALDPLPAYVYSGGIKYQDVKDLYNYYKKQVGTVDDANCSSTDPICTAPPPIGPYFPQCVKFWSQNPASCWGK